MNSTRIVALASLLVTSTAETSLSAIQTFSTHLTSASYAGDSMYVSTQGSLGGQGTYIPVSAYDQGEFTMVLNDTSLQVIEQSYRFNYKPFSVNLTGSVSSGFGAPKTVTATINFTHFAMDWIVTNDFALTAMTGGNFRFATTSLSPVFYNSMDISGNFTLQSGTESVSGNFSEILTNQNWLNTLSVNYNYTPPIVRTAAYPDSVIFDEGVGRQQSISYQLDGAGLTLASGLLGGQAISVSTNYFIPRLPNQMTLFAVPEPSTVYLSASLLGLGLIRARTKRS